MLTRSRRRLLQRRESTFTSSSRIPPELIDYIIDCLHRDCTALKACSLVCKSWLPRARFHLLHNLHLPAHNANSFLENAKGMHPSFVTNVRSLEIGGRIDVDPSRGYGSFFYVPPMDDHWKPTVSAWKALANWPSLESLTLNTFALPPKRNTLPSSATLKHLYILSTCDWGEGTSDLVYMIGLFPRLESVELNRCWMRGSYQDITNSERLPPTFRSLTLKCDLTLSNYINSWICAHESLPPISSATLNVMVYGTGRVVTTLGENLKHLTLSTSTYRTYGLGRCPYVFFPSESYSA